MNEGSGQYTYANQYCRPDRGRGLPPVSAGFGRHAVSRTCKDGERIGNYEYGAYAQASKALLDERLKLAVAGRVDQFQNFGTAFSPRASVVYSLGADKQHNFRASFSRAFRAPTQNDQYIRLDVGRAILLGNVGGGFNGYTTAAGQRQLPGILAPTPHRRPGQRTNTMPRP